MSKKTKGRKSIRGHDETKTVRYRQVVTNIPIGRDGKPVSKKAQLPPSAPTAISKAMNATDDIHDNPMPKVKAKVLQFVAKKNPVHIPYQVKGTKQAANSNKFEMKKQGLSRLLIDKEKKFLFKLAYTASCDNVYVPSTEAVAQQALRIEMLSSGEHDMTMLTQKKLDKGKRALLLEHMAILKEHPEDVQGLYHGSIGVSRDLTASKLAEKYGDSLSTVHESSLDNLGKTFANLAMPSNKAKAREESFTKQHHDSASRNNPGYTPSKAAVEWFANNVVPSGWPADMQGNILAHLNKQHTTNTIDSGETYRRTVLMNSYEQQLTSLEADKKELTSVVKRHEVEKERWAEEEIRLNDEIGFLMWEVAVHHGEEKPRGNKGTTPTPNLCTLHSQLKAYLSLHRSDPVKNFLRVNGYNSTTSETLKAYNGMRRQQLSSVRTEVASLKRIGSNIRSSLDNQRQEQWTTYVSDLGVRRQAQQACIDVTHLVKNRSAQNRWANEHRNKHVGVNYKRVIDKQFCYKPSHDRTSYVQWWSRQEGALTKDLLLRKPVNKAAYKTIKFVKKVFKQELNPVAISRQRKALEAKEVRKYNNKVKKALDREVKAMEASKRAHADTARQRMRTAMRLAH